MNKFLKPALATIVAGLAMSMPITQAQTVTNAFNVSVTLTSQCQAIVSGTQTLVFGTYVAFQATALVPTPLNIEFNCSRGFIPSSVALDSAGDNSPTAGLLAGLQYTISVAAGVQQVVGTAATNAVIGTADTVRYVVSASMPAGQAGTDTNAATANAEATHTRTMTVTY